MHHRKMSTLTAPSEILDKKWQKMTYEKHRKRLREVKGTIREQNRLHFNHEEVQLQMRLRRAVVEERRQAIIDQENRKLLERLLHITTHQRTTFPTVEIADRKHKKLEKQDKTRRQEGQQKKRNPPNANAIKLPPIKPQETNPA